MRTMKDRSNGRNRSAARLLAIAGLIIIACVRVSVGGPETGDGHAAHAETPADEDVLRVAVTRQQVEQYGIKLAVAEKGNVATLIRLPGEVALNENATANISPRVTGIIDTVATEIGMRVNAGDTLLTLTSVELGRALAEYKRNRTLVELSGRVLKRDTKLREQNIGSEQDMIDAQMAFEQYQAEFKASEQTLRVLGLTEEDVKAGEEHGAGFGQLQVRAPFAGTIIEKHAVTGELAEPGKDVLLLSDLSTVWVNLAISQDALSTVREGQQVTIRFPDGTSAETQIGLIAPTIDRETRTALARAELPNEAGAFRPGTFVEAILTVPGARESLVLPAASIQLIHDYPCVFVWDAGAFILREVVIGATDGNLVEIVRGLTAGDKVAAVNAFHLKAEFIKSSAGDMGDHHGHAH